MSLKLAIAKEGDELKWKSDRIDYLPFGVKTLKVEVSGDYNGPLYLVPERRSSDRDEQFGYEDREQSDYSGEGTPQFIVSWGGGQEGSWKGDYPQNKLAHFLLHHKLDSKLGDYTLTIQAFDAKPPSSELSQPDDITVIIQSHAALSQPHDNPPSSKNLLAELQVTLTCPRDGDDLYPTEYLGRPEWKLAKSGLDGCSDIYLHGRYTPRYVSRWWPHNRVVYYTEQSPLVQLHFQRQVEDSRGAIAIYVTPVSGENKVLLAEIQGQLEYPLYDMRQVSAELYYFGSKTWALRVWFFWLDLKLSREDLGRYGNLSPKELEVALSGVNGEALRPRREAHEIPDAERIDIVFDEHARPLYAATDLHYREMWGEFGSQPKIAKILNTVFAAAQPRGLKSSDGGHIEAMILNTAIPDLPSPCDAKSGLEELLVIAKAMHNNMDRPFKPHEEVLRNLNKQTLLLSRPFVQTQSHCPAFQNVIMQSRLTSTDVREG
jgi:hypothetical protein